MRKWVIAAALTAVAASGSAQAKTISDLKDKWDVSMEQLKFLGGGSLVTAGPSNPKIREVCSRINRLETALAQRAWEMKEDYILSFESGICHQADMLNSRKKD